MLILECVLKASCWDASEGGAQGAAGGLILGLVFMI